MDELTLNSERSQIDYVLLPATKCMLTSSLAVREMEIGGAR